MPKKTKTATKRRTPRKIVETDVMTPVVEPDVVVSDSVSTAGNKTNHNALYGAIVVAVIVAGILLFKNGYIVSATVNGQPIFTWQLVGQVMSRYGKQSLENMITEKMITGEASKNGISVTQSDIDSRENTMVKQFGSGVTLAQLLQYQGMTKKDLDGQMRIQLEVEKILSKDITISDLDVSNYLASNSAKFTATDEATLKSDAKNALLQEKISAKIQPWFDNVKKNAKVMRLFN
jgi:hypothetical protein